MKHRHQGVIGYVRNTKQTLVFSSADVSHIVARVGLDRLMDDVIHRLVTACEQYDESIASAPQRGGFEYDLPHVGLLEWMPAIRFGDHALIKIVGYHPQNPEQHALPTILSTNLRYDVQTGHLSSIIDGTFLTALRTGAASAVASRVLAAPGSSVLGIIGAGAQAITQLHGLSRVFQFDQVLLFDSDPTVSASFHERAAILGLTRTEMRTASCETVVGKADILCTATSVEIGAGPVFQDHELIRSSLHINAVGSDFPGKTEVPSSLLKRSLVCPDFRAQAIREGECQQLSEGEIGPDLVDLIQNAEKFETYRERPTVFDSTGWAIEDLIAADVLMNYGLEFGCGTLLDIESLSHDPKDPYAFVKGDEAITAHRAKRTVGLD